MMNISAPQLANLLRRLANPSQQPAQSPNGSSQPTPNVEQLLSSLGTTFSNPRQNDVADSSALQGSLHKLSGLSNLDASQLSSLSEQLTPSIERAINNGQITD